MMDLTEKYIKMCEKAKDIQEHWKPKKGDFYIVPEGYVQIVSVEDKPLFMAMDVAWIPRQDQLQDMISELWEAGMVLNYGLMPQHRRTHLHKAKTFEQAWLMEVMFTKYGKVWDADKQDWVE